MSQSTRSSRVTLKAVGSGSSVNLFSALPVGVRQLPHAHRQGGETAAEMARLSKNPYRETNLSAFRHPAFDAPSLAEAV